MNNDSLIPSGDDSRALIEFPALGDDWAKLLGWFEQAERLPAEVSSFTARYGQFEDPAGVAAFVSAIARAQELSRAFGSPEALRRTLVATPDSVSGPTPPDPLPARLVWVAGQVANSARTFAGTLENLATVLAPSAGDEASRAMALKQVLAGEGGLVATAAAVRRKVTGVRAGLAPLSDSLSQVTTTLAGTLLLNEANRVIGGLGNDLQRLSQQAAETCQRSQQLADSRAELERKQLLIADLKGFFLKGNRVMPVVLGVDNQLRRIEALFERAGHRLLQFCAISNQEQLSRLDWVQQALDVPGAVRSWRKLEEDARSFTLNALSTSRSNHV